MPVVRQLRKLGGLGSRDGALAADREVNPATAARTAARKAGVVPPGAYQWIVHGRAIRLHAEIHGLHPLTTAGMGAIRLGIDDVRGHATIFTTFSVERVHPLQFFRSWKSRSRQRLGHCSSPQCWPASSSKGSFRDDYIAAGSFPQP